MDRAPIAAFAKGGNLQTYQTLESSPGLEDLWQLHWSYNGMLEHNASGLMVER